MNNLKKYALIFITILFLIFSIAYQNPTKYLSFFTSNKQNIEDALVSENGILYFKIDSAASIKAFNFIETEITNAVRKHSPEKVVQYDMLKNMQDEALSLEKYGKSSLNYGALYFNKNTFVDIVIVSVGEFNPKDTLAAIKKDFSIIPNILLKDINEHSIKITSTTDTNGTSLSISGIIDIHPDKMIIASEGAYNNFMKRMKNPEPIKSSEFFRSNKNDFINVSWNIKSTLDYFGFLLSMYMLDQNMNENDVNSISSASYSSSINQNPSLYLEDALIIKTSNPEFFKNQLDIFFNNPEGFSKNDNHLAIHKHLKDNLVYSQSAGQFMLKYKWNTKNISFIVEKSLLIADEYEKKLVEQQKMLEQKVPSGENDILHINPELQDESKKNTR